MNRRQILGGAGALAITGAGAAYWEGCRMGSSREYNSAVLATREPLSTNAEMSELIRFAALAANSHNTQPWLFHASNDQVSISPDPTRRTPVVDPDDHHLFLSLGCAAENFAIAANACGRPGELSFDSANGGAVVFAKDKRRTGDANLFDAIPRRQSTRNVYDGKPVASGDMKALAEAASVSGVDVIFITARPQIEQIRDLVVTANTAQMGDPNYIRELRSWLRFSPRRALETGDGLFSALTGNPSLPEWVGRLAFDWMLTISAENDKYARQIQSSSGLAIFISKKVNKDYWVRAGRASQRFALQATALGLKVAFMNQPIEVEGFRPQLAALIGLSGRRPDLLMRFGFGAAMAYSARRDVRDITN